jgi:hypothetical protein
MNCLKFSKLVTTPSVIKFNNFSKFARNLNQSKEYGYLGEFKQFLDSKDNNVSIKVYNMYVTNMI